MLLCSSPLNALYPCAFRSAAAHSCWVVLDKPGSVLNFQKLRACLIFVYNCLLGISGMWEVFVRCVHPPLGSVGSDPRPLPAVSVSLHYFIAMQ